MRWQDTVPEQRRITDMGQRIHNNECILTWKWPEDVQFVYIYGFAADKELPVEERSSSSMKLYTREEYKAKAGYSVRLETIGSYTFRVYPCEMKDSDMLILKQEDADNKIRFSTGKARIVYSIKYSKSFFSKLRSVRIELNSEVLVPKEALCYVKKEGAFPLQKDDGTMYPFIHDIMPGRNALPEIEIQKQDQIKLFFTDGKKYGEMYELIPE
ncbi:hypothetical protein [Paenibacillus eucommiae]|uniref:Beta-mannanase n=1 Tax=Paenibacillus eucommiae TaxID=1355755 RepID=A0ABS4IY03_9BACL|nr:hypothetical protein [Paenibacillus eucommiae]MBP1992469.1 hypothetical protein [Paenibacillus eucommiae]